MKEISCDKMSITSRIEIGKFNGQNFELWNLKMEDLLVDREKWIVLEPRAISTGTLKEDCEKLDRKYQSTIQIYVVDSILLNVSG